MTAFDDLAQEELWVAWMWQNRPSGMTKVPYQANGAPADSTDPRTWNTLAAIGACSWAHGAGIMLNGTGLGGIDLDHCRDPETGEIDEWALQIIRRFRSYAEISPSGTGVKILAYGAPPMLPGNKWYPPGVAPKPTGIPHADVFVTKRFFTVTRRVLDFVPDEIVDCGELDGAWDWLVYQLGVQRAPTVRESVSLPPARDLDDELVQRMDRNSRVRARWEYGTEGGKDRSSNDAALATAMAIEGFSHSEIRAAVEAYPLGQVGSGKLQGPDAERQVLRLLELSEGHRPVEPVAHPEEASNLATAIAEGFATAQRAERIREQTEQERQKSTPLMTLAQMSIADLLDTEPPEREWIIENVLPLGVTGTLSAAGGTGKSWAMITLAVSMAMQLDFWGLGIANQGGVLILSAEDDRPEFHRRLHAIIRHIVQETGQLPDGLTERLAFADRVGDKNAITAMRDGQIARTEMVERIVATARLVPDCKLIIADPLSRFRGGSANGEEEATRFVEALEFIRKETGATVLVPSHTGKEAGKAKDGSQHAVRGSSALVDGMRWVGTLMSMHADIAKELGVSKEDARRYVRLEIPKNNYAPPFPGCWLYRNESGILVRQEPADTTAIVEQIPKADREYQRVLALVVEYVRSETEAGRAVHQHTLRMLSGASGMFAIGEKQMRAILGRAIAEGRLVKVRDSVNQKLFEILAP